MSVAPARPRHHVTTERVRVRYYEDRLGVTITRGVGWRGKCSCSWRGGFRRERHAARLDAFEHASGGACE